MAMDAVKATIAKKIQEAAQSILPLEVDGAEIIDIEVQPSTPLVTTVRLRHPQGIRYFEVIVKERWLCLSFTRGLWEVR